jgi:hypothetical protein
MTGIASWGRKLIMIDIDILIYVEALREVRMSIAI